VGSYATPFEGIFYQSGVTPAPTDYALYAIRSRRRRDELYAR
jgi:hypothetical protein